MFAAGGDESITRIDRDFLDYWRSFRQFFNVGGLILNIGLFWNGRWHFLELVIVGVVLFVISTVTWQLTSTK